MKLLSIKLEGKWEDLQWIQVWFQLTIRLSTKTSAGLRRCLRVGNSDEEFPLQQAIFLDTWDIHGSKD